VCDFEYLFISYTLNHHAFVFVCSFRVHQPSGLIQFLLKWKGYPDDQNTWEYEYSLQCPNLVEEFMKRRELEDVCFKTPSQTGSKPLLNGSQKETQIRSTVEAKKTKLTNKRVREEQVVKPRLIDSALRIRQEIDERAKQEAPSSQEKGGRESEKAKKQETEKARSINKQERDSHRQFMLEDDDSDEFIPKSIGRVIDERSKLATHSTGKSKNISLDRKSVV